MRQHFGPAVKVFSVLFVLTGFVYPLLVMGLSQLAFTEAANGSLVKVKGQVVGSRLLAQKFTRSGYFHSRPSVNDYNTLASGGSNFSPISAKLRAQSEAALSNTPPDLIFASGSGLDPDITEEAARYQAKRVAEARQIPSEKIEELLKRAVISPQFGFLGVARVNVLILNSMLDETFGPPLN